jgi:hypothetical protein
MRVRQVLFLVWISITGRGLAFAQVIIADPKLCAEADMAKPIVVEESPLRIGFHADATCLIRDDRGKTLRVWKYPHHYQRLSASKKWKVTVETGNGSAVSHDLPYNSVIGVTLERKDGDKWKNYRGRSSNPTQPAIVFTVRKANETRPGGLKQEHVVWDMMTVDALELDKSQKEKPGLYPAAGGKESLRIDEVWVWQGLNPIPKKINARTLATKVRFSTE